MQIKDIFSSRFWASFPLWLVTGASMILFFLIGFTTFNTIQSQKENAYRLLLEKGTTLIHAFETSTRIGGIATSQWQQGFRLQHILQETAKQPEIRYIFVIREDGTIVAHSQPERVGMQIQETMLPKNLKGTEEVQKENRLYQRILQSNNHPSIFEVYSFFLIKQGAGLLSEHHINLLAHLDPIFASLLNIPEEKLMIFVGLDMHNVEKARISDMWHSLLMSGTMLLVGFAGIIFVFLFQSFQLTRSTLFQVRAFSKHLVENMPIGIIAFDDKLILKALNPFAVKLLDIPPPLPETPARLFLPEALFNFIISIDIQSSSKESFYKEISWVNKEKHLKIEAFLSRLAPVTEEESGDIVLLIRDLSEIDALRKEVLRNQRLVTVGKLAAGVAHEIRNPLSSIKGFATLFRHRHADNPEECKIADIMIQEVDRLNRVVSQLLDFSRPVILSKRYSAIRELAEASLQLVSSIAKNRGISLENRIEADLYLHIDEDRIQQLLLNLFLNAIDAMQNGGSLKLCSLQNEKEIKIEIHDTGRGVEENALPHIFDPYYTTKASGTGLGLAIAHNIMEAHLGKIKVSSRPELGSVFTLVFPGKDIQDASCHPHR